MEEPTVRTSRIAIAAGIAAALVVGGIGFMVGRSTVPPPPPARPPIAAVEPPASPPRSDRPSLLDRAGLLSAVAQATDAFAAGTAVPPGLADLADRRFSIAIPFGCIGAAGSDNPAPLRWSYDDAKQALHVHVAPVVWDAQAWGDAEGRLVGFWVTRPWSSSETCPAMADIDAAPRTEAVTLPGQTLAIADSTAEPPGGSGYDAVIRVPRDKLDMRKGLRARLTGRIRRGAGGSPVRCIQPGGIDQQPVCVVTASFDELVVENPATGETLATWSLRRLQDPADPPRADGTG